MIQSVALHVSRVAGCAGSEQTPLKGGSSMTPFPDTIRRVANADGGVVLDLRHGKMFRVNLLGAKVLDLLEQGDSPTQIAEKLSTEFGIAPSEVEADVREFIESLKTHGVLVAR
jgi:hypothetical protein